MDKRQFADKVAHPVAFTSQERGWLRAMADKYPFSSVVATLSLLADHAHHFDTPTERRAVALAMCNSDGLAQMIDKAEAAALAPAPHTAAPHDENKVQDEPQDFDILNEINTFQEISFKTAPKSVILSNFLQVGPQDAAERAAATPQREQFDDKKSLRADESLGTETLAVILEKQGKYDRALAIYRNLLAQNPEKSSTFAPRIERLEALINSK